MARQRGFTLIELMVVVAILGLLSAVLVPNIISMTNRAKASKIASLADVLTTACNGYNMDIGGYAIEYTTAAYTGAGSHQLSMNTGNANWKGPYIRTPLANSDNPMNSAVYLYAITAANGQPAGGFDLNNDGANDVPTATVTAGNTLILYGMNNQINQLANSLIDGDSATNPPATWNTRGKFEANAATIASIYIIGGQ